MTTVATIHAIKDGPAGFRSACVFGAGGPGERDTTHRGSIVAGLVVAAVDDKVGDGRSACTDAERQPEFLMGEAGRRASAA